MPFWFWDYKVQGLGFRVSGLGVPEAVKEPVISPKVFLAQIEPYVNQRRKCKQSRPLSRHTKCDFLRCRSIYGLGAWSPRHCF